MRTIRKIWLVPGVLAAAGVALGLSGLLAPSASAATTPGPALTVVGYALVNVPPPSTNVGPQQLQIMFQESAPSAPAVLALLHRDEAKVSAQLEKAGVSASAISHQGPLNFNINQNNGGYQVNDTLQMNFPSLLRLATVLQASGVSNAAGVQNVFAQPVSNPVSTPSAAALATGYQSAFANAAQTAQQMAQADSLQLGQATSIAEGSASSGGCNAMGGCNPQGVGNPPAPGQNQELVSVTVTYNTNS